MSLPSLWEFVQFCFWVERLTEWRVYVPYTADSGKTYLVCSFWSQTCGWVEQDKPPSVRPDRTYVSLRFTCFIHAQLLVYYVNDVSVHMRGHDENIWIHFNMLIRSRLSAKRDYSEVWSPSLQKWGPYSWNIWRSVTAAAVFLFKHCRSKCDFNSCSLKVPGAAQQPWPMCNWICTHACMHTCSHIWNAHPQACTVYTLIQAHECTGMNTHACTHACINSALSPKRHMAFSVCSQSDLMRKRLCSRKFCWQKLKICSLVLWMTWFSNH